MKKLLFTTIFSFLFTAYSLSQPSLVKDINDTPAGSGANNFIDVNGTLFFTAFTREFGWELWKSDGTAQGTVLVKDISKGDKGYRINPDCAANFNGILIFAPRDDNNDEELWRSDGSETGTYLIKNIKSSYGSYPREFTVLGNKFFFSATPDTPFTGPQLFSSDGTEVGTNIFKSFAPEKLRITNYVAGVNNKNIIKVGNLIYFVVEGGGGYRLCRTDGTQNGTYVIKTLSNIDYMTDVNGVLYFSGSYSNGKELWKSDGTANGTVQIKDIKVGSGDSDPRDLEVFNGILYFSATDETNQRQLWKSDGASNGTVRVKNFDYSSPGVSNLKKAGNKLFFWAYGIGTGRELWQTDGTDAGTNIVKDITPGIESTVYNDTYYGAQWMIEYNGVLYFNAIDNHGVLNNENSINGEELYRSDGTEIGTYMVKDIYVGNGSSRPQEFIKFNNKLIFQAKDQNFGTELWQSDGTTNGTTVLKDIQKGTESHFTQRGLSETIFSVYNLYDVELKNYTGQLCKLGDKVIFNNNQISTGIEPYVSDGTEAGTFILGNLYFDKWYSFPERYTKAGNYVYFTADSYASGRELYKTDGTINGTQIVKDITPNGSSFNGPPLQPWEYPNPEFFEYNNNLIFSVDATSQKGLWKTDGTSSGTGFITNSALTSLNAKTIYSTQPEPFISPFNGQYIARLYGLTSGTNIYQFSGSAPNVNPLFSTYYGNPCVVGNTIFMAGGDNVTGSELFSYTPPNSTPQLVKNINPEPYYSSTPQNLINYNNKVFFLANNGTNGIELWKSDGTQAGTQMVKDINVGRNSSFFESYLDGERKAVYPPNNLIVFNNFLYFIADDGINGRELWRTDGTEGGTQMVKDINVGSGSSTPLNLIIANGSLYFSATDGIHGVELWKSDGTATGTMMLEEIRLGNGDTFINNMTLAGSKLFFFAYDDEHGEELWKYQLCEVSNNQIASLKSGEWNDTSTWQCGLIPSILHTAVIDNGHTVSLNQDITVNGLIIRGNINIKTPYKINLR